MDRFFISHWTISAPEQKTKNQKKSKCKQVQGEYFCYILFLNDWIVYKNMTNNLQFNKENETKEAKIWNTQMGNTGNELLIMN